MTLGDLASISEVVGAIGVIGTLIFLSIETRKNTTATRQQSYHNIVTRRADMFVEFGRDREMMNIFVTGLSGGDFDALDSQRFLTVMLNFMSHFQDIYMQFRVGTVESKVWEAEHRMLAAVLEQPGFVSWWKEASQYFMPEFVEAVAGMEPVKLVVFDQETREWGRPGGLYKQEDRL